jgi:preprotein translocase subunit SecD
MTDDRTAFEVRLHDAFRREGLPPAPPALLDALDHVASVAATRQVVRRSGRLPWGAIGIAAMLAVGTGLALFAVGSPRPAVMAPSASPSAPLAPVRITYQPMWTAEVPDDSAGLVRIAAVLRLRLAEIGINDATTQVEGGSIVVEFPSDEDSDAVRSYIGQTGRVVLAPLGEDVPSRGMPLDEGKYPALCDSEHIVDADVATDQTGDPALQMKFDVAGTRLLAEYTRNHIGSSFAIALDGKVLFTPMVVSEIPSGDLQLSFGQNEGLSAEELSRLAAIIKIGPLPVPIREVATAVGSQEPGPTPQVASPSPQP